MPAVAAHVARSTLLVYLALAGSFAASAGCSASSSNDATDPPQGTDTTSPALTACGTSVESINGKSCASSTRHCTVPITCGSFVQQARCTCENDRFACVDSTGPIPPGHAPRCVDDPAPDEASCPDTMFEAQGKSCGTMGKTCYFQGSVCPERLGIRNLNYCRCTPREDGELAFECTVIPCNPLFADGGT
jgi:hypothetical protein